MKTLRDDWGVQFNGRRTNLDGSPATGWCQGVVPVLVDQETGLYYLEDGSHYRHPGEVPRGQAIKVQFGVRFMRRPGQ